MFFFDRVLKPRCTVPVTETTRVGKKDDLRNELIVVLLLLDFLM